MPRLRDFLVAPFDLADPDLPHEIGKSNAVRAGAASIECWISERPGAGPGIVGGA